MRKILYTLSLGLLPIIGMGQNQVHISQSMLHQAFVNPAAMASYKEINGAMFYKTQWTTFEGAPQIGGFNISSGIRNTRSFVGLTYVNDKIGVTKSSEISASYSYRTKLASKTFLSFGLSSSLVMMQSNLSTLNVIQGSDPIFQADSPVYKMPNFKFGAYYFKKDFYFGMSIPNLLTNKVSNAGIAEGTTSFDMKSMHVYFQSGYMWNTNDRWDMNASILYKNVYGAPAQFDFNWLAVYNEKLGLGLAYRTSKEILVLLNYMIKPELKLGYAYDINLSALGGYSSGTHEVMFVFEIPTKEQEATIIAVPRF